MTNLKNQNSIKAFELPALAEDTEADAALLQLFGLMLGVYSIFTTNRYTCWAGVFSNLMGVLNQRNGDKTQVTQSSISAMSFSILSLYLVYNQIFSASAGSGIFTP